MNAVKIIVNVTYNFQYILQKPIQFCVYSLFRYVLAQQSVLLSLSVRLILMTGKGQYIVY